MLSATNAAMHLGVAKTTLLRLASSGALKSEARDGRYFFRPEDVEAFKRVARNASGRRTRRDTAPAPALPDSASKAHGKLAAEVFKLFREGKPLDEIVILVERPPALIRDLYAEWTMGLREGEMQRRQEVAEQRRKEQQTAANARNAALFGGRPRGRPPKVAAPFAPPARAFDPTPAPMPSTVEIETMGGEDPDEPNEPKEGEES
jgi:hypothetical protein